SWVEAVQRAQDEQAIISAHLDLLESQIEPAPDDYRGRLDQAIAALEGSGFRVVRVPAFRVDLVRPRAWPGISYVNGLVVDGQVFVPRFGLPGVEDGIFQEVGRQLPTGYTVVPIDAQRVLIRNGGLHCLAALLR